MFVHRRRNLQKRNTLEIFLLVCCTSAHTYLQEWGSQHFCKKCCKLCTWALIWEIQSFFLAFVTCKDDEEEFMMPGYSRFFFPLLQLTQQIWRRDNRGVNLVPHQPWGLGNSGLASSQYKTSRQQLGFCLFWAGYMVGGPALPIFISFGCWSMKSEEEGEEEKKKKVAWQWICFPLSFSRYDFSGSSSAFDCEAKSFLGRSRRRRWFGCVSHWDLKCLFSTTLGTMRILGLGDAADCCGSGNWHFAGTFAFGCRLHHSSIQAVYQSFCSRSNPRSKSQTWVLWRLSLKSMV